MADYLRCIHIWVKLNVYRDKANVVVCSKCGERKN